MTDTKSSATIKASPVSMTGVKTISNREFGSFQALIQREAGIYLSQAKRDLLVNRLSKRLRELGLATFEAYYELTRDDESERIRMLDRIATNETSFFREPRHFEYLEQRLYPEWQARADAGKMARRIRIWSSACSTGEEPYSLAMSLLSHFSPSVWDMAILGTDISTRVLERAEQALWPLDRASQIPPAYLKTFMLRGTRTQEGKMKAGSEIRSLVSLKRFNLNAESYPFREAFDVIFCRNVLIYFDVDTRKHVLERLTDCLAPGGVLVLGHAETACGLSARLKAVVPSVYYIVPREAAR